MSVIVPRTADDETRSCRSAWTGDERPALSRAMSTVSVSSLFSSAHPDDFMDDDDDESDSSSQASLQSVATVCKGPGSVRRNTLATTVATEARPQTPWRSVYVAAICTFIQSFQFSIFASSLWPYIKNVDPSTTEAFFGNIVALYSFGQCVAAPAFGYWSNRVKQIKLPMVTGLCCMFMGNVIYMSLELFPFGHKYVMLLARLLTGCGSGNMSLLRAYASMASTSKDRSRALACISTGVSLGLVLGPAFQLVFVPLGEKGIRFFGMWTLSVYNAPAIVGALMNIVGICILKLLFKEEYAGISEKHSGKELGAPDLIAVGVIVLTRFTQIAVITNMETLSSPYSMMMFSFTDEEAVRYNSTAGAVQGVLALAISLPLILFRMRKWLKLRCINVSCLILFALFYLLTYPWDFYSEFVDRVWESSSATGCNANRFEWCTGLKRVDPWVYYIAFCTIFEIAFALMNITLTTLFSKIIGPRRQGTMQGVFQMVGSVGRMSGPILLSNTYTRFGPKGVWGMELGLLAMTIVVWISFLPRMVPFHKKDAEEEKKKQNA